MARPPKLTDDELLEMARQLASDGNLSVRSLRARTSEMGSGADSLRCREAVKRATDERRAAEEGAAILRAARAALGEADLPAVIRVPYLSLLPAILSAIGEVRSDEIARARAHEAHLRAEYERAIAGLSGQLDDTLRRAEENQAAIARLTSEHERAAAAARALESAVAGITRAQEHVLANLARMEEELEASRARERGAIDRLDAAEESLVKVRSALQTALEERDQARSEAVRLEARIRTMLPEQESS
jgi:DNA repair exonuclease SbcCD ATPase subunit